MEYFASLSSSEQRAYLIQRLDMLSKSMQERQLMRDDILLTLQKLVEDEKKPNQYVTPSERCKNLSKHIKPRKAATIKFESRITQSVITTVDISTARSTSMLSKLTDTFPRTNILFSAIWHSFRSTSPRNNSIFDFLTLRAAFT